jgi:type IV secretion system protein TrbH
MRLLPLLLGASCLVGCVTLRQHEQERYGNLVGETGPAILTSTLSNDAVKQLMAFYPPSNTGFYVLQPTPDQFGISLLTGLRAQGYQVLESHSVSDARAAPGLKLGYLVDVPLGADVYRVTLYVGPESISRAYVLTAAGGVSPAGPWSRRQ